jgi:POT family proton-dependent oligopeptide transporter
MVMEISRKNTNRDPEFWNKVKPSQTAHRPEWMTFDDAWVDELSRGIQASKVFAWYPVYWLAYGQMTNNLVSQASTMTLHGAPNDIISNLNPIFIIILIPLMDKLVYPKLRDYGINFTPIKRITCGFFLAGAAMVSACVTQHYIYTLGSCGDHPNADTCDSPSPINVWVQILPYALIGASEIMASITSLEYAFTKAPKNMRSFVQAIALFTTAVSSAMAQALVGLSEDPLLVWNYGIVAVLAFTGGVGFYATFRKLDKEEDKLNNLPETGFSGEKRQDVEVGDGPAQAR